MKYKLGFEKPDGANPWFYSTIAVSVFALSLFTFMAFWLVPHGAPPKIQGVTLPPQAAHTEVPTTITTDVGLALSNAKRAVLVVTYGKVGGPTYHAGEWVVRSGITSVSFPLPPQAHADMAAGLTTSSFTMQVVVDAYVTNTPYLLDTSSHHDSASMNVILPVSPS